MSSPSPHVHPVIDCIDCGEPAYLLTRWDDEDPPRAGDLAVYRCSGCNDRWDTVVGDPSDEDGP